MYWAGKKGQCSAAKESLCALWEKQVILASFYTGLHIVSTCAGFFLLPLSFLLWFYTDLDVTVVGQN